MGWECSPRAGVGAAIPWECQPEVLSLRAPLCGCWAPFPPGCGLSNLHRDLPPASSVGPDQATSPLDTHSTSIYGLTGHWFQHTVNEHLLHTVQPRRLGTGWRRQPSAQLCRLPFSSR